MSLRNKLFLLFALSQLAACGFSPVYGQKPSMVSLGGAGVVVEAIPVRNHMNQQFKADLEDKLNPAGTTSKNAEYRLKPTLTSSAGAIGVAPDGTVSRYNVYLDSAYELIRNSDNKVIARGTLRHVSSYNNPTSQYFSTYMSEQDATKRGVTELTELYQQRLSPYLQMNPEQIAALPVLADAAPAPQAPPLVVMPNSVLNGTRFESPFQSSVH